MSAPYEDAGLAVERTDLAWQRYALVMAAIAVLSMRAGLHGRQTLGFVVAFVLALLAVLVQVAGPRLRPQLAVHLALTASLVAAAGALALAVFQ